jgi:PAS domain-containing protein
MTVTSKTTRSSSTEESSSKSVVVVFQKCKLHVHDVFIILAALALVAVLFVTAGGSYFPVLRNDMQRVHMALESIHTDAVVQVNSVLDKTLTALHILKTVVQSNPGIDYSTQFLPVMDAGIPLYVDLVTFNQRVLHSDKDAFISAKRASGGLYSNFTIQTKQTDAEALEYYPVVQSKVSKATQYTVRAGLDPTSEIAYLGQDVYDTTTKNAFAHVIKHQTPSVSNLLFATFVDANKLRYTNTTIMLLSPIVNQTRDLTGVFATRLNIALLVADTIRNLTTDIIVSLYDTNDTAVNGGLIYDSRSLANNISVANALAQETFTVEANIPFLTNVFRLKCTTTRTFVDQKQGGAKWIGTIICCIVFVVGELLLLSLFIFLRLRKSLRARMRNKRALHALKDSHERTKMLLSRLAKQEAKSRATVDAVPDFVIILNSTGRIVHTNKTFDKLFGYSQKQLESGLQITTVIPALTANIFVEPKYTSEDTDVFLRVIATSNTSVDMDVKCIVKNLYKSGMEASSDVMQGYTTPLTPLSDNETSDEEDEAFTVIGRVAQLENIESFDLRKV